MERYCGICGFDSCGISSNGIENCGINIGEKICLKFLVIIASNKRNNTRNMHRKVFEKSEGR